MNKLFKVYKKITNIFFYILISIFLIYAVNIFINRYVYHDKFPRVFNYYIFNIASGSMEKGLHKGDFIVVKKTKDFKAGDVVTFQEHGEFITHRVMEIDGDVITTKGDANNIEDASINRNQIIGKYVLKSAVISFIFKYRLVIVGLIIISVILGYLIELLFTKTIDEEEKNDEENNESEEINEDEIIEEINKEINEDVIKNEEESIINNEDEVKEENVSDSSKKKKKSSKK